MRRIDRRVVGQLRQPVQRPELRPGQRFALIEAHQVGARCGPDDERATREHRQNVVILKEKVGKVLRGVAGSRPGAQTKTAEIDLVAIAQPNVRELSATGGRSEHPRPVPRAEPRRTGDEVRMQMRLRCDRDRETTPPGDLIDLAQIPRRIDRQPAAVAEVDHIRAVAEPLIDDGDDDLIRTRGRPTHRIIASTITCRFRATTTARNA